jgi:hypothetical protein
VIGTWPRTCDAGIGAANASAPAAPPLNGPGYGPPPSTAAQASTRSTGCPDPPQHHRTDAHRQRVLTTLGAAPMELHDRAGDCIRAEAETVVEHQFDDEREWRRGDGVATAGALSQITGRRTPVEVCTAKWHGGQIRRGGAR